MACEKKLVMMPNSFFYNPLSDQICGNFVRLALCKKFEALKAGAAMFKK
jgi:hypothetical protein